jgi:hypothetical protein
VSDTRVQPSGASGLAVSVLAAALLALARALSPGDDRILLCMAATVFGVGGAFVSVATGITSGFGRRRVLVGTALGVGTAAGAVLLYVETFHFLVQHQDY